MIKDIISSDKLTMSFEVFPPRGDNRADVSDRVMKIAGLVSELDNTFISVTHRLGTSFDNTIYTCREIKHKYPWLKVVPHMTTIDCTAEELCRRVKLMEDSNLSTVFVLRGDAYDGYDFYSNEFSSSVDMVKYLKNHTNLEVGASFYPEGYSSETSYVSTQYALEKQNAGVDYLISQMVYSPFKITISEDLFRKMDVTVPYTYAFLPILSAKTLENCKQSNVQVPTRVENFLSDANEEAFKQYSRLYLKDLVFSNYLRGQKHSHIYTMDNVDLVMDIVGDFKSLINS